MTKKIVVFADGTGNAFNTQESNVWRLYQALDQNKPDQIAYYIPGVGTSSFRPFAMLDGATGIGVPSNVRKLYRFISWNWRPGDKIYMFGFSRGSFTIRTLIGMIESQGLAPTKIAGKPATHDDMVRNARSAWREYRRHTASWSRTLPTIWATRFLRDALLFVSDMIGLCLSGRLRWSEIVAQRDPHLAGELSKGRSREETPGIPIEFVGLFDTVEAYGVPIEELRVAIDWAIWPISFRNRKVSAKVRTVRHALSIDDERTTFHPLRFDVEEETCEDIARGRIKEVWFAGVHSDVGGGYPDGALSYVPLVWLTREAIEAGLKLTDGALKAFEETASALAPLHDLRAGAAVLYRYDPRRILQDEKKRPPVVHVSVAEKMVFGSDNYAPVTLPGSSLVLMPDGSTAPIRSVSGSDDAARKARALVTHRSLAASTQRNGAISVALNRLSASMEALEKLHQPDEANSSRALDAVWWRRIAYFALLAAVIVLALLPLFIDTLSKIILAIAGDGAGQVDSSAGAALTFLDALESVLPSYARPYLKAIISRPFVSLLIFALAALIWRWGVYLRDAILDFAREAWKTDLRKPTRDDRAHFFLDIAEAARKSRLAPVRRWLADKAVPAVMVVVVLSALSLAAGRTWFAARMGAGDRCVASGDELALTSIDEKGIVFPSNFRTSDFCQASTFRVEADRKYRIRIAIEDPWFDRTIMTGVHGFTGDFLHVLFYPIKRSLSAAWFQPILRVGARGASEIVLMPLDATSSDAFPRQRQKLGKDDPEICDQWKNAVIDMPVRYEQSCEYRSAAFQKAHPGYEIEKLPGSHYEPLSGKALEAAQAVWKNQQFPRVLVADFVPEKSGELFLYVNDAVAFFPMVWWPENQFYRNNAGTARVTVQRMPLPEVPPEK